MSTIVPNHLRTIVLRFCLQPAHDRAQGVLFYRLFLSVFLNLSIGCWS